jgi:branched-chain amino acid transport system substrate-binding protein
MTRTDTAGKKAKLQLVTWRSVGGGLALVAVAALVVAASSSARLVADPGVTATSVLLGGTVPLTGEAAAFGAVAPGAKAYFDHVNARGGVHGRRISYRYYDDAYNPATTVQLTRRLVEQDGVFAVFNGIGTAPSLAVRDYLNARKVPQLFAGDGSQAIGRSFARHPWTMGFLMSYRGEGDVYGKTIVRTRPRARIAVLYENTDLGRDMLTGLTRAIAGKGPRIVARQAYEFTAADVGSQIATLKASGADTLMLFATPKFFIQAVVSTHRLGWRPQLYIASVSIEPGIMAIARTNAPKLTRGALSIAFVKNPNDPIWAKDRAVALYRTIMRRHNPTGKPADVYNWYGMTVAWTMVETLRKAGKSLTRASLLRAAQSLDLRSNPFLLPGIRLQTSRTDYRPLEHVYLYRYDNEQWVRASGLLHARG